MKLGKSDRPDLPVIFLFLSDCGWNQESPGIEVVSVDANSTIHDFVEEEGGYWAANEIGEAQTAVSDVVYYRNSAIYRARPFQGCENDASSGRSDN